MSAPNASTSPATPRNDAAERYSPPIAQALRAGRTVREATKKSDVVRLNRSPQMPMPTVSTETTSDRDDAERVVHRGLAGARPRR